MQLHLVTLHGLYAALVGWEVELGEGRLQLNLHSSAISKVILMFQPGDRNGWSRQDHTDPVYSIHP